MGRGRGREVDDRLDFSFSFSFLFHLFHVQPLTRRTRCTGVSQTLSRDLFDWVLHLMGWNSVYRYLNFPSSLSDESPPAVQFDPMEGISRHPPSPLHQFPNNITVTAPAAFPLYPVFSFTTAAHYNPAPTPTRPPSATAAADARGPSAAAPASRSY